MQAFVYLEIRYMTDRKLTDFHADDYGLSMNNSIRIMQLLDEGRLDSISIIPNMSSYKECMEYLNLKWDLLGAKPLISVHLNIADGFSLSEIDDPLFTKTIETADGEKKVFHTPWGRLFICSFIPGRRKKIREELTEEFALQIRKVWDDLPEGTNSPDGSRTLLRLDSHTHTHMIPVVFDAMMDAVEKIGAADRLAFVRVSREPGGPFKQIRGTYPKINRLKNMILNLLSRRAEHILDKKGISYGLLWGLIMSGRMDRERVEKLLPQMVSIAESSGKTLEILSHPGIVLLSERYPEFGADDMEFVYSSNRDTEYDMVKNAARA